MRSSLPRTVCGLPEGALYRCARSRKSGRRYREETAMQQAVRKTAAPLPLKDPKLFRQQGYINGKWADADSKRTVDVNNPATGEILGTVPYMGAAETHRAIDAANAAWPAWRKKTAKERANILRKWFNLIMA